MSNVHNMRRITGAQQPDGGNGKGGRAGSDFGQGQPFGEPPNGQGVDVEAVRRAADQLIEACGNAPAEILTAVIKGLAKLTSSVAGDDQGSDVAAACARAVRSMPHVHAGAMRQSGLTDRELTMCREKNIDPAKYEANRAAIRKVSSRSNGGH